MKFVRAFWKRVAGMAGRGRQDEELTAELEAHLQFHVEDNVRAGMTLQEARRQALIALGGMDQTKEAVRERRGVPLVENIVRDLRIAVRVLAKDPRFSILAVLGLGLGLGVTTAIFTLINASARNDRAPAQDSASYIGIFGTVRGNPGAGISYGDFRFYQTHATSFSFMNAESGRVHFVLGGVGTTGEDAWGRFESENFLSTVGLTPALGRAFTKDEALAKSPVVVLNYRFWKNRLGGDPNAIGSQIRINTSVLTVIGVASVRFGPLDISDFYLPLELQPTLARQGTLDDFELSWLDARLKPSVTSAQAQAELDVLSNELNQTIHKSSANRAGVIVSAGGDNPRKHRELMALAITATMAVSMILLIACANLANILLARGVTRRSEIAIRLCLGATRARVISLLMTESLMLALSGAAAGLLFSHWLATLLFYFMGAPAGFTLAIDPREWIYAVSLSVAAAVSFGLAPALVATRSNLSQAAHSQGLSKGPGSRKIWALRNVLVVAPLAISLVLLSAAGAVLRGMQEHYLHGPGFDTSRLTALRLELGAQGYNEARTKSFQESLRERIATMPAVTSVALAADAPLADGLGSLPLITGGSSSGSTGSSVRTGYNVISPDFFQTVGISIERGRNFTAADRDGTAPVAIVNRDLANKYWKNEEPVGKEIRLGGATGPYFVVIGVAPDFEDPNGPLNTVQPTVYIPYGQESMLLSGIQTETPPYQMQFLVRTSGDPAGLKLALRQEVLSQDPSLIIHLQTIREMIDAQSAPVQTVSLLLSALGGLALIMAAVGIYAIMAYTVSQQTREIGIRVALGASRHDILAMVMRRTLVLIAWGIGFGLAGALAADRVFSSSLADFKRLDPVAWIAASVLLAIVTLFATYMPARKALRIDPVSAMRCE